MKNNVKIEVMILNSEGGFIKAGYEIADFVIGAELDTRVVGVCECACAKVLLAGKNGLWHWAVK